eukprot:4254817-Prymnesium_polylepis.1
MAVVVGSVGQFQVKSSRVIDLSVQLQQGHARYRVPLQFFGLNRHPRRKEGRKSNVTKQESPWRSRLD